LAVLLIAAAPIQAPKPLQPPAPRTGIGGHPEKPDASPSHQGSGDAQRGTAQAPIFYERVETPEDRERAAEANREHNQQAANENLTNWIAIGALAAGLLQFCALVVTIWVMDRSAKRQLRAYVAVAVTDIFDPGEGLKTRGAFIIENFGETPAYEVSYLAALIVLQHPLPDKQADILIPHEDQPLPTMAVHKGQKSPGEAFFDQQEPFSPEAFTLATTDENYRLYMVGIVEYRDAFRIKRKTRFAAYIENDVLKAAQFIRPTVGESLVPEPQIVGKIEWVLSHAHNDAT
jgi:hypothetical protein